MASTWLPKQKAAQQDDAPTQHEEQRKPGGRSLTSRLGKGTDGNAVMTPGKRGLTDAIPASPAAIKARIAAERVAILTIGTTKYAALRAVIAEKEQTGKSMFAAARTRLRGVVNAQKLAVGIEVAQLAKQQQDDASDQRVLVHADAERQRQSVRESARTQARRIISSGRAAAERVYAEQQRTVEEAVRGGSDGSDVSHAGNTVRRKLQTDALADHDEMISKGAAIAERITQSEQTLAQSNAEVRAIPKEISKAGSALERHFDEQLAQQLAVVATAEQVYDTQLGRLRQGAERVLTLTMRAAGFVTSYGAQNLNKLTGASARFAAALEQRIQVMTGKVDAALASTHASLVNAAQELGRKCQREVGAMKTQLGEILAQLTTPSRAMYDEARAAWRAEANTFCTEATAAADKAVKAHGELADKTVEQLRSAFAKGYEWIGRYGEGIKRGILGFALGLVICVVATLVFTALLASSLGMFAGLAAMLLVIVLSVLWLIGRRLYLLIKAWNDLTGGELLRGAVIAFVAGIGDLLGLTGLLEAALGFDVVTGATLSDDDKAEKVTTGVLSIGAVGLARVRLGEKLSPTTEQVSPTQQVAKMLENPTSLWGKTPVEVAKAFNDAGFNATVRQSTRGSGLAQVIAIEGHPEVTQIQIHPGGGRHGGAYVKMSTSTKGIIKIVDPATYKPTPGEKATIIYAPGGK